MPKIYTSTHNYDYPLPAVSLAYFLRYPNPYSTHVLSTDVISRHFDPTTQRLHTTRLHLKRSKLPTPILKLLPKGIIGGSKAAESGQSSAYILEKSTVDIREGWMETESRNLEWTGILSVVERARYTRPAAPVPLATTTTTTTMADDGRPTDISKDDQTAVTTTVVFHSHFGQSKFLNRRRGDAALPVEADDHEKKGFFSSWSTAAVQRTIEVTGMQRTRNALVKSKDGMNVVLERLRLGGLRGVLDGMRRDEEGAGRWGRVWKEGGRGEGGRGERGGEDE